MLVAGPGAWCRGWPGYVTWAESCAHYMFNDSLHYARWCVQLLELNYKRIIRKLSTLIVGVQRIIHIYYTCSGLCVGSVFEEECSEMWYALWIVRFRESIEFWTHNVLSEYIWTCVCLSGDNVCVGNAGTEHVSVVYCMWIQTIDKPCMLACCSTPLTINHNVCMYNWVRFERRMIIT